MCKCNQENNTEAQSTNIRQSQENKNPKSKYIKELGDYEDVKPNCFSFWLPVLVLLLFAVLMFLPQCCWARPVCVCCCTDTCSNDSTINGHDNFGCDSLLRMMCSDSTIKIREVELTAEHFIIKFQKGIEWPSAVYGIVLAIIILLAVVFMLKHLVPYWIRIAELNDKQKERLIKLAEERLEFDRLGERTKIGIMERLARVEMDEKTRDEENNRKIELMKQEYQTHLADVALEMVKSMNQSKEKESTSILNQLLQILKK